MPAAAGGNPPSDPLRFFRPTDEAAEKIVADGRFIAECPLHGHVNWELGPNGDVLLRDYVVALKEPDKALIATPGVAKKAHANEALGYLWNYAMRRLEGADAIVLVGYRFHPTDNHAKLRLLAAMRKNRGSRVHVVIGPNNEHMPRVKGMATWTRENHMRVIPHELFAEDFFAAFDRPPLFEMLHIV